MSEIQQRLNQQRGRIAEMSCFDAGLEYKQNAVEVQIMDMHDALTLDHARYMAQLQDMLYLRSIGE